jgi:hypothetical protein
MKVFLSLVLASLFLLFLHGIQESDAQKDKRELKERIAYCRTHNDDKCRAYYGQTE